MQLSSGVDIVHVNWAWVGVIVFKCSVDRTLRILHLECSVW